MHVKPIALAAFAALALSTTAASADDFSVTLQASEQPGYFSADFGATKATAGAFTDTFTFSGADQLGLFDGSLITIGFQPSQMIDFEAVSFNGQSYQLFDNGSVSYATLSPTAFDGALVVTVSGVVAPMLDPGTSVIASYAGTANVAPIPEPETYALMLAGLGLVGWVSKRRARA